MRKTILLAAVMLLLNPFSAFAQVNKVIVPFTSSGYLFKFVKSNDALLKGDSAFKNVSLSEADWDPRGVTAFGTINNTKSPPCPLNDTTNVKTFWPSSRDLLIRKHISLPNGAKNLRIQVALDNGAEVFFNGERLTNMFGQSVVVINTCATLSDPSLEFKVPDRLVRKGNNVLAIHGIWLSSKNFLNVKVTGDVPVVLTTSVTPVGAGTIVKDPDHNEFFPSTPAPVVSLTALANPGYHFVGWTGDTAGATGPLFVNPLDVTMYKSKNLTAVFAANVSRRIVVSSLTEEAVRAAIVEANANPGVDTIQFAVSGEITFRDILPELTDATVLEGTGQPVPLTGTPVQLDGSLIVLDGRDSTRLNGIEVVREFLPWGYTPGGSVIRGFEITGFPGSGICLTGSGNVVQRNWIHHNGGNGICIEDGDGNVIGDAFAGPYGSEANLITFNRKNGVVIREISHTDAVPPPSRNSILGNSIFSNALMGIDLAGDGPTSNRYQGGPTTPLMRPAVATEVNDRVNFPTINIATLPGYTGSIVEGYLLAWRSTTFRIDVFVNDTADVRGEGQTHIGSAVVTTDDDSAYAWFALTSMVPLEWGQFVSATATDEFGNTSEFSPNLPVGLNTQFYEEDRYGFSTTYGGIPLHQPDGHWTYTIDPGVLAAWGTQIVGESFRVWSNEQRLSNLISGEEVQSTVPLRWGGDADGINAIKLAEDSSDWVEETQGLISPNTIAVTRLRYYAANGSISDADILFNSTFDFADLDLSNPDTTKTDKKSTIVHEFGHALGASDMYLPGYINWDRRMGYGTELLTMYGIIRKGETHKRSLEAGDIDGIEFIYTHVPKSAVSLVLLFDTKTMAESPFTAFHEAKNSASELVKKLRPEDQITLIVMPDHVVYGPATAADSIAILDAIDQITTTDGSSQVGQGLLTAQAQLASSGKRRAVIVLGAQEEGVPDALSVASGLASEEIEVYTLGFEGGSSDAFSLLAQETGGRFYEVNDSTTLNVSVRQMWNDIAGWQLVDDTTFYSEIAWQGGIAWKGGIDWRGGIAWKGGIDWRGGIAWKGAIDPGTTTGLPGIAWKGSQFVLFLIPPVIPPDRTLPADGARIDWEDMQPGGDYDYFIYPGKPGYEYVFGETWAYYVMKNPLPGEYTFFIEGVDTNNEGEEEPIKAYVVAINDVTMNFSIDKLNAPPGSVFGLQVLLSEGGAFIQNLEHVTGGVPISTATVSVVVTPPGSGDTTMVDLNSTGNGLYAATFDEALEIGTYTFKVTATGQTSAGEPFTRIAEQSVYVAPAYGRATLFAEDSIVLGSGSRILSGSAYVNSSAGRLYVGKGATTSAGSDLKANTLVVDTGGVVGGDVYFNNLTNSGVINGEQYSSLELPLGSFPPFNAADPAVLTAPDYSVGNGLTAELKPDADGRKILRQLVLQPHSMLTIKPGVYHFRDIWLKSNSQLIFEGSTELRILHDFAADNATYVGPKNGALAGPTDILFYVGGRDTESKTSYSVNISPKSNISANVNAPNGSMLLNQETVAVGAFVAKSIVLGNSVQVGYASAFGIGGTAAREGETIAEQRVSEVGEIPTEFALRQNYPNPFNPSTTIQYALPSETQVTLMIYNMLGEEVARLVDEVQSEGYHTVTWNGRSTSGLPVSTGVYFYRITAGTFVDIKKMVMLK